jgi:stage III sporulation protein AB
MLIKLLGCGIVLFSTTFIGYHAANKYSKRLETLRALQISLEMLETHISFSATVLPDAFEKIANTSVEYVNELFLSVSKLLRKRLGMTAKEAWNKSLVSLKQKLYIEKEDEDILKALGNSLGNTDCENQIRIIELTRSKLNMLEKKADVLKQKNDRLYKTLGVLSGLLIILLLV